MWVGEAAGDHRGGQAEGHLCVHEVVLRGGAVAWGAEAGAAEDVGAGFEAGGDVGADFCDDAAAVGAEGLFFGGWLVCRSEFWRI